MYSVRVEDQETKKTLYLFPDQSVATRDSVLLACGHLDRFEVQQHSTGLGWVIKDKESGRIFDAQGLAQ